MDRRFGQEEMIVLRGMRPMLVPAYIFGFFLINRNALLKRSKKGGCR